MTNPTPLSPAAQAVWEAFNQFDHAGMHVDYGIKMAAALRAVADQMAAWADEEGRVDLDDLLAIAAELEGAQ